MSRSFIPSRDGDLVPYAVNIAGKASVDPEAYAMTTAFATLLTNASQQFQHDLVLATSEATRSPACSATSLPAIATSSATSLGRCFNCVLIRVRSGSSWGQHS